MQTAIYKVPNGKLLKIFFELKDNKIVEIKITGDFFIYPEEKISELENAIRNEILEEKSLIKKLQEVIEKEKIELFGVSAESIVKAITNL